MDEEISLRAPDDCHLHLRDGAQMACVLPHSARQFARAIIMPNLTPPVVTVAEAVKYRQRILTALSRSMTGDAGLHPLMTLYLTDLTCTDEVLKVAETAEVLGFKYYPAGATTNSASGVTALEKVYPLLERMQEHAVPLLVHGEVTIRETDIFDREAAFIDQVLITLTRELPALRIVFEHITTAEAVAFVQESTAPIAATITAHHLLLNRNALFAGGLRPHHYCLPVLKAERHRQALLAAAVSGDRRFFLGTDSAPHAASAKLTDCGCAGIYSALCALEIYAEVFYQAGCVERLEGFASEHGADFYGLPPNSSRITLRRDAWTVPASLPYGDDRIVPLLAGEECHWRLLDQ